MIPILILAAGQSSRMRGADKLMQPVDGVPLIRDRVLAAVAAGLAPHVVLPDLAHPRARALAGLPHHPLILTGSAEGMGGSLRDGVAALPPCPGFLVMPADMPELTAGDLARMAAARADGALILIATDDRGALGHPARFDAALRPDFAKLRGDRGARDIVGANRDRIKTVPLPGRHATCDLDTPEEWADWRARTGR